MFRLISLFIFLFFLKVNTLAAERLKSGETLRGSIRAMDEQILYLDSNLTSQQIRVDRSDIRLIEFENSGRSMSRRLGVGVFYHPSGDVEQLSLKNWVSPIDSLEILVSYKEGDTNIFNIEGRFSRVLVREGQYDLFSGVGGGLTDTNSKIGTSFRIFAGSELFLITNPNIGLGVEIGVLRNSDSRVARFDESNNSVSNQTFFSAFTARYYF